MYVHISLLLFCCSRWWLFVTEYHSWVASGLPQSDSVCERAHYQWWVCGGETRTVQCSPVLWGGVCDTRSHHSNHRYHIGQWQWGLYIQRMTLLYIHWIVQSHCFKRMIMVIQIPVRKHLFVVYKIDTHAMYNYNAILSCRSADWLQTSWEGCWVQ